MSVNSVQQFLNVRDSHLRVVSGNVHADQMVLGGITVDTSHGLQSVTNTSNVTTNTVEFSNATTAFVTTANVEVGGELTVSGNATVSSNLTVTGNALISDDLTVTENLTVTGNTFYTNPAAVLVDSNVVTEYTGPHDRPLRKYPEVAMTSASQGGYNVTQSNEHDSAGYYAYEAFNGITNTTDDIWYSSSLGHYNTSDGSAATSGSDIAPRLDTNTDYGEWVALELPKPIKLDSFKLWRQNNWQHHHPVSATLYAKKTSSDSWSEIYRYDDIDVRQGDAPGHFNVNSQVFYGFFAFVARKRSGGATNGPTDGISLAELEYYGYEEGSGSLDTTLKSVYNVPATTGTQLEVYYDGQDFSSLPATVTDKAGTETNATITNTGSTITFDSTYKAWVFGGDTTRTDTFISAALPSSFVDDQSHSVSLWFNPSYVPPVTSSFGAIFSIALATGEANSQNIQIQLNGSDTFSYVFWNNDEGFDVPMGKSIVKGQWYHLSATYEPSTGTRNIFLNGEKCVSNGVEGANPGADLDIQSGSVIKLGARINGTQEYFGSIANFRLYSKALNAGQVQELYDYQKDYFLGSKSQVTLYKGHLGVGVTEPSGQLELAGDERIQEYPPRGLVGDELVYDPAGNAYDYNVEGHGVFKLLSSLKYHNGTGSNDRRIYKLFDKSNDTLTHWGSFNSSDPYDAAGGSGAWVTTLDGGSTITAHIAEIQMPYKITLKKYILTSSSQVPRALKTGMIVGSNDGNVFHVLHNVPDFGFTATLQPKEYTVDNTTTPYRIFRLLLMNTNGHQSCNMNEWRLFGTPGPTTLDKGSLSLTRSLDVPRVSRYDVDTETPRPEKLVVDFDTTVNSSPTDISGKGNHGVFYNGASYSPVDKAFVFDGTDDYIKAVTNLGSGNKTLCFSMWLKPETDNRWFIDLGKNTATGGSFFAIRYDTYYQFNVKNGNHLHISAGPLNTWEHLVIIYHGTGSTKTAGTIEGYVNGVPGNFIASDFVDDQLNLSANPPIEIGARTASGSNQYFDGKISNFKLYSVALEPSEVKKLYNLGRTGRSMVISDTAVGIGKAPEAQLDVRGTIGIDNILWRGGNWTHPLLPEAEFYWNPQSYISKPFSNATTAGSTITDMNGKMNGIQGNTAWYNNWWKLNTTSSYIETVTNIDLRRNWTMIIWNKSSGTDRRLAGHGQTGINTGFHLTANGGTKIRFGFHGNDVDSSEDYFTDSNTWCQFAATYYHATGATQNRQVFQNERKITDMRGGLLSTGGGSAVQTTAYAGSPTPLRFGTTYGTGNNAIANNRFGPIAFFGRVLSAGEIRSLYNYFRITWQSGDE